MCGEALQVSAAWRRHGGEERGAGVVGRSVVLAWWGGAAGWQPRGKEVGRGPRNWPCPSAQRQVTAQPSPGCLQGVPSYSVATPRQLSPHLTFPVPVEAQPG